MIGRIDPASIPLKPGSDIAGITPGTPFQTTVRVDEQGLPYLRLGAKNMPLDPLGQWTAGTRVSAVLSASADAPVLTVTPLDTPAVALPNSRSTNGTTALARLIAGLVPDGSAVKDTGTLTRLIPLALPQTASALSALVQLFAEDADMASSMARLAQWLSQGRAQGKLTPGNVQLLDELLESGQSTKEWGNALRQAAESSTQESRMARLGRETTGLVAPRDWSTLLVRLLRDDTFNNFLRDTGQLDDFEQTTGKLQQRFEAASTQNLRGLEQPYRFLELPMAWMMGFNRAQVHFLADGRGGGGAPDSPISQVALDLDTEELGPLWVQVRRSSTNCECQFHVAHPETLKQIREHQQDLADSLLASGLPQPRISVISWDPSTRLEMIAGLFVARDSLDVGA